MKVFLCHSSNDKEAVRVLHQRLKQDGLDPGLDEQDLLPGVEWEPAIEQAVRGAGVVLVCLSKDAVSKRGFVQKEIVKERVCTVRERRNGEIVETPVPCN